jgi:uncharacterized membrane protein
MPYLETREEFMVHQSLPQHSVRTRVSPEEYQLLQQLRERKPAQNPPQPKMTWGDRIADTVVATMGSWRFIIIQTLLLSLWVVLNVVGWLHHWDPYPFILLNLMLSFQAGYAAPFIMMSQNRQAALDRQDAHHDYEVNLKAELEIELLHDKMQLLRETDISVILHHLDEQKQALAKVEALLSQLHDAHHNSSLNADESFL